MDKTVRRTIEDKALISPGDRVVVALSGGADSVALLSVLKKLSSELTFSLYAAHVNHQLRGEESLRDENFVRDLCKYIGVELFVKSVDVRALAIEQGISEELCGRNVRYGFFSQLSKKLSSKVATAHTLSDSEETMLYNIARGTSLHGLCSIPYKRDYIIRPLLDVTREEVEEYCSKNSLSFVQDSTNFIEDICSRNKLRLSVLPPLRELNAGFHNNFSRLRSQLCEVDSFMQSLADKAIEDAEGDFGLSAGKLTALPKALLKYTLARYISKSGADAEYRHLELCEEILFMGGAVNLPFGYTALCKQGFFRVLPPKALEPFGEEKLSKAHGITYDGKNYSFRELTAEDIIYKKLSSFSVGCDKINDGTVVRTRRGGDTFTLIKRGITKPLRKLQNELKIPAEKRDKLLLVANGSTVLWAEGIGTSLQGEVDDKDKKGIYIEVSKGEIQGA
ncbi:MAG: tRNA lysidine(34) synthetase TilS [Ruminococcus sp.]